MYEDVALPVPSTKHQHQERWLTSAVCIGHEKRVQPNKHFVSENFFGFHFSFPFCVLFLNLFDHFMRKRDQYARAVFVSIGGGRIDN